MQEKLVFFAMLFWVQATRRVLQFPWTFLGTTKELVDNIGKNGGKRAREMGHPTLNNRNPSKEYKKL